MALVVMFFELRNVREYDARGSKSEKAVRAPPGYATARAFSFFFLSMDTWITPFPTHSSPWRGGQLRWG